MGFDPVFGDSRFEEQARRLEVKGTLIASRRRFVLELHGREELDRAVAELEGKPKEFLLRPPPVSSWYANGIMMDMDRAILDAIGNGPESMRAATRKIAPRNIKRLYKVLVRLTSTHSLIARLSVAWKTLFSQGRLDSRRLGSKSARIRLLEAALPLYMCSHGVCGWLEAAMDMRGTKTCEVVHSSCIHRGDSHCTWDLSWD